jgi:hypothetical protein
LNPWSDGKRAAARKIYDIHQELQHRLIEELDRGKSDVRKILRLRYLIQKAEDRCASLIGVSMPEVSCELKREYRELYPQRSAFALVGGRK